MANVTTNNIRSVVTVTAQGPQGPKGDPGLVDGIGTTLHLSGSVHSGSGGETVLTALTVTASFGYFIGDGSGLTNVSSSVPSGTISGSDHIFTAITSSGNISASGTSHILGGSTTIKGTVNISGSQYSGSGAGAVLTAMTVTGSILPEGSGSWDLGSPTNPFRDLYITTASLKFVSRETGQVVSSLSAQNVEDLKLGKTITTATKTLTKKDGTTETKTKFLEGTAFISSIDSDVYIKTSTNQLDLIAGGSGAGNINIGSINQTTNLGPTRVTSSLVITGSVTISGSNSLTNYGQFTNYLLNQPSNWGQRKFTVESKTLNDQIGPLVSSVNQLPYVQFVVSASGHVGVGTLEPQHALHVSESSTDWNTLQVEGQSQFNGFAGGMGFGNPTTLTGNTVVPAGYNVVLWTSNNSPSLTIPVGSNYTVGAGSNIKMVNMDNL